jgi:UDP-N-acetylmuramoylalanine--D-glutamate ligase
MMREPAFQLLPRPARTDLAGKRLLVLGLGDTGLSVARWAERHGARVRVADTRAAPPRARDFAGDLRLGAFEPNLLDGVDLVCISPGLALDQPVIHGALSRSIPVLGDVELFAWSNAAPVLAVTGTNGKSTVTALAAHLLRAAGTDAQAAGNISPPVLDAALSHQPATWVLELSSYQLETTWSLNPRAAVMLNLTEDHLDRYPSVREYGAAKARIFQGDGVQVLNRDDPASMGMALAGRRVRTFGLDGHDFGVRDGYLVEAGERLLAVSELPIHGAHNVANALAACALVRSLGVPAQKLAAGLKSFRGLPHRLELVRVWNGVHWYDDSKGTNVGATIAALRGLGKRTVLILGGDGKGQDFSPLRDPVQQFAVRTLLIGRDAPLIESALAGLRTERCATLEEAVQMAAGTARAGEAVLLSPACASFDMFRDYKHRGEAFAEAVRRLK